MGSQTYADLTTAGVIHDLNNLLQTILQAADLIAADPNRSIKAAIIARTAEKCRSLLASEDPAPAVPLAGVVAGAVEYMRDHVAINPDTLPAFIVKVDPNLRLESDRPLMERALINLFVNAAQAAQNAGRNRVEIRIDAREGAGQIILAVRDDGPGIPDQLLRLVFTPRVSGRPGGAGLGLRIVESAVAALGGAIAAANQESGGAIFTMCFPAAAEPNGTPQILKSLAASAT